MRSYRKWQPTLVLLPGKSHGRGLVGCSPWGRKELDTTERLHFTLLHTEHRGLDVSALVTWSIPRLFPMLKSQEIDSQS